MAQNESLENDEVVNGDVAAKKAAVKAYNAVVAEAALVDVRLMECKFKIQKSYYAVRNKERDTKKALTKREFEAELVQPVYSAERGLLGGNFKWTVDVRKGKQKLVTTTASYFVLYKNVPSVDEEHAKAFLSRVGRFATYPYLRALVARLSAEANADLPILPVLR